MVRNFRGVVARFEKEALLSKLKRATSSVLLTGGWKADSMLTKYTRKLAAKHGAVARVPQVVDIWPSPRGDKS